MKLDIHQQTLELANEGLLAIRDGQATRIHCLEGTLWITEEGDVKDTILRRGDTYTVRRPGLAILTSLGASRITLEEGGMQYAPHRLPVGDTQGLAQCA